MDNKKLRDEVKYLMRNGIISGDEGPEEQWADEYAEKIIALVKAHTPLLPDTSSTALKDLKQLFYGCGNHACRVQKPQGQGTNGPCSCASMVASLKAKYDERGYPQTDDDK
jgi:hypothetical protein